MRKGPRFRISMVAMMLASVLLTAGPASAANTYAQPLTVTLTEAQQDILIVPPEHGQIYNNYGPLGGASGGPGELNPYENTYLRAIEQSIADWDRAVAEFGAEWLRTGLVTTPYVLGRDTIPDAALTDPEIVIVTDQKQANSLAFANGFSTEDGRTCIIDSSKLYVRSFTEADMYNTVGHEVGHCLGLEHSTGQPEDGIITRDLMYWKQADEPGAVGTARHCMSNLNVMGVEQAFGGLFGQPGGQDVSIEPSEYRRIECEPASSGGLSPSRGSTNFQMVAQIRDGGATDLELFSRELREWKDASGSMNVVPEGQPPVKRHFALIGNEISGPSVVDVTDPKNPFEAARLSTWCRPSPGVPRVAPGGMLATLAMQRGTCILASGASATSGAIIIDMGDVYAPRAVAVAEEARGARSASIHPSGRYIYLSVSEGAPGIVPIYDISDPSAPRLVRSWDPGDGGAPRHIRFSGDGARAYLAGGGRFRIVDTSDPENPRLISSFTAPGSTNGHDSLVTPDKAFLFAGEELRADGPAGPNGVSPPRLPEDTPCPGGAVYVYDIRGAKETSPELIGVVEAGAGPVTARNNDETEPSLGPSGPCSSAIMDLNPNARSLTLGWQRAGSRVIDFSGLYDASGAPNPQRSLAWGAYGIGGAGETGWIVPEGANTRSAKQYSEVPGYIFSADKVLGFYVTKIEP